MLRFPGIGRARAILAVPLGMLLVACSLESAGQARSDAGFLGPDDGGVADVEIDRGNGVTEAGTACKCMPALPAGWTYVGYQRDGSDKCTGSFASAARVAVEAAGPAPTCGCTCGKGDPPTCTPTATSFQVWNNALCFGNGDATITGNSACFNNGDYVTGGGNVSVKGTATFSTSGGSCNSASPSKTVPPLQVHTGETCGLTTPLGTGCSGTDACVPLVSTGFAACIESDVDDATCPTGYTQKHRVGPSYSDTRDCSACTCTATLSCSGAAQFHSDDTCTKADQGGFALDGACHVISVLSGLAARSSATIGTGATACAPSAVQPTGGVKPTAGYTVCCL
jgi:hypothetical protein